MRPAFLPAAAAPFFRKATIAFSKSPFVSSSAALHSIIPAPVASRNFLNKSAEIAISKKLPVRVTRDTVGVNSVHGIQFPSTHAESGRTPDHAPARPVRFELGDDAGKSKKNL